MLEGKSVFTRVTRTLRDDNIRVLPFRLVAYFNVTDKMVLHY